MLDHVSGSVYAGAKIGILGINGAGKSTFLKILAGEDTEYDGQLDIPSSLKVGYLSQEPSLSEHLTVEETLKEALEEGYKLWDGYIELQNLYRTQTRANSEERKDTESKMNKIKKKLVEKNWTNLDKRVQRALVALRCPPSDSIVKNLSGGERRRIALCSILLQSPDILLLDEPTNHLDAESVAYLERFLREYRGTVLAVTHDRFFLENSAGWILEVADGHLFPHKGNYTGWLESKQKRIEMEEKKDRNLQKFLKRELEWIRKPAKARQAKSQARVKAYEKLADTAREKRWESGQIKIPPGRRLGKVVLDVDNLSKSFEDGKCLFKDLSFVVPPGSIVGIVGPNGAGKTTLLRTLLGEIEPDSGKVSLGETVDIGYVSQSRASLDENSTVHEEISNGVDEIDMGGGHMINSRFYTACFHFKGKDQNKGIKYLSGGERNRVHLAKMLNRGYNLIVLDEPTNDLDIEVLSSLEDALSDFAGSSIIVSHDRWFLNRVCTHILCFDGTGNVEFFEGNYSDFMESNQAKVQKKQKYITLGI